MRILVVSHAPLSREFGGAQSGMNLAEALRALGHDALVWSPEPLPPGTRWWNHWLRQRHAIERFAAEHGPFDVIDTQAISASSRLVRLSKRLVVRSIQPELLYLASNLRGEWAHGRLPSAAALLRSAFGGLLAVAIVCGWRRADIIVCLGKLELEWMRRRFPWWSAKLSSYVCCPSDEERAELAVVRRTRQARPANEGVRFLWIGRWVAHKGPGVLVRFLSERAAKHPKDTFTIAGCGTEAEAELPAELLQSGRIRVIPWFKRVELPGLLAAHDAGLFTSTVEGWGISLNEMLESGMPVFATSAGGADDLRPYFEGSLFPFPPPWSGQQNPVAGVPSREYLERFQWSAIALEYEKAVLDSLPTAG